MAKRKFNPKSKILGRYFDEIPYGLKEINSMLSKPLFEEDLYTQYRVVMILLLINKREEALKRFTSMKKEEFYRSLSCLMVFNSKVLISMIRGASDKKRKLVIDFITNKKENNKLIGKNLELLLKTKDKDLSVFEKGFVIKENEESLFTKRTKTNIESISGKEGNISFYTLRKDDRRALYLDHYSDCCQGFSKAGESCMIDGITNPDAGFLVFERKGVIFAQGWLRKVGDIILIDSIEFKGDFNSSLVDAIRSAGKALKYHYKGVYLGLSPNRREITNGLKDCQEINQSNVHFYEQLKEMNDYVRNQNRDKNIYTDAYNSVLKLR